MLSVKLSWWENFLPFKSRSPPVIHILPLLYLQHHQHHQCRFFKKSTVRCCSSFTFSSKENESFISFPLTTRSASVGKTWSIRFGYFLRKLCSCTSSMLTHAQVKTVKNTELAVCRLKKELCKLILMIFHLLLLLIGIPVYEEITGVQSK